MENTNKKRYWLRGGVMDAFVTFFLLATNLIELSVFENGIFVPAGVFVWGLVGDTGSQASWLSETYKVFIPYGFFLGSIIGFIYGKIKNRKSATSPSNVYLYA